MAGSGGLVILDEDTDIVKPWRCARSSSTRTKVAAGAFPCREGTTWLKKILTRFR